MRVVAVTTCLSHSDMVELGADAIYGTVSDISVDDLRAVSYTREGPGGRQGGAQEAQRGAADQVNDSDPRWTPAT